MASDQYRYMVKIVREMTKYKEKREKENTEISAGEETLLHLVRHHEGLTQKELGALRNIDKATITRQLKSLEEKGYIYKQSAEDKRNKRIYSTEKTKNLKKKLVSYEEEYLNYLFESIDEKEKEQFLKVLTVLYLKSKQESRKDFEHLLRKKENAE